MQRLIIFILFALSVGTSYADYASRGKPWDDPNYHESPLTPIFMIIGVIVLIIIGGVWLVYKNTRKQRCNIRCYWKNFCCRLDIGRYNVGW